MYWSYLYGKANDVKSFQRNLQSVVSSPWRVFSLVQSLQDIIDCEIKRLAIIKTSTCQQIDLLQFRRCFPCAYCKFWSLVLMNKYDGYQLAAALCNWLNIVSSARLVMRQNEILMLLLHINNESPILWVYQRLAQKPLLKTEISLSPSQNILCGG